MVLIRKLIVAVFFALCATAQPVIPQLSARIPHVELGEPTPETQPTRPDVEFSVEQYPVHLAYRQAYTATVVIYVQGHKKGTGVLLKSPAKDAAPMVLTAFHVVDDLQDITVRFLGESVHVRAMVVHADSDRDLALIGLINAGDEHKGVVFGKTLPKLGDPVTVIGNPNLSTGSISRGILSNVMVPPQERVAYYRTDAATYLGNSGGGLFNARGQLIGIAHASEIGYFNPNVPAPFPVPGGALFIGLPTILEFLEGVSFQQPYGK